MPSDPAYQTPTPSCSAQTPLGGYLTSGPCTVRRLWCRLFVRLYFSLIINPGQGGKDRYSAVYRSLLSSLLITRKPIYQHAYLQEFEDIRVPREDWPALKPNTPFGQMPMLEVDGVKIGQTVAIANYLGREFGLYGKTNMESCKVDQVVCLVQDFLIAIVKAMFEKDEAKKAELMKVHTEEVVPNFLGLFEKLLKQNGTGYFVGSTVTLADLFVYDLTWNMVKNAPTFLDGHPLLKQNHNKVGSVPQIKAYVDARKHTDM
ncbi:hypothetical protein RRG08_001484 [Elysia crispata]|uniref:Glutathione S-transferase n=1 Tax=Elysia crispata TaxID=231223 RepID=A0AAE1AA89_9GAST|nr:hypothetical protein RRG08_001484 [Elysia crispata]